MSCKFCYNECRYNCNRDREKMKPTIYLPAMNKEQFVATVFSIHQKLHEDVPKSDNFSIYKLTEIPLISSFKDCKINEPSIEIEKHNFISEKIIFNGTPKRTPRNGIQWRCFYVVAPYKIVATISDVGPKIPVDVYNVIEEIKESCKI